MPTVTEYAADCAKQIRDARIVALHALYDLSELITGNLSDDTNPVHPIAVGRALFEAHISNPDFDGDELLTAAADARGEMTKLHNVFRRSQWHKFSIGQRVTVPDCDYTRWHPEMVGEIIGLANDSEVKISERGTPGPYYIVQMPGDSGREYGESELTAANT
jgi:hypothetical protein